MALTHSLTSTATNVKKQTMLRKTALTTMNTLSMVENGAVPLLTHSLSMEQCREMSLDFSTV